MAAKKRHIVIDARIRRASTGRYIDRLLEHLQAIDSEHRYSVLVEPEDTWKPTNKNFTAIPCRFKRFSFNPLEQVLFAKQLYSLHPDLVHFGMTPQEPVFYFGKRVTTTHDLTMLKFVRKGRLPLWLHKLRMAGYRFLLWQAHLKASTVIVPTEYVADALKKYHLFTNRKIAVTLEASEPPISAASQEPENPPQKFILYVGSAFPHKNLERLVSAFGILREHHQDYKLVLVGKLELHAKQLRRWIKQQGMSEHVLQTGFVSDEELKWYYEHTAAYVFPSMSEGFGLPALEAMVHGCPVASSNATCLPEVCGDAAHYFDPYDIHDMARAIDEVISKSDLRKKLVERGYQQVKKFSWKKMADQTLAIYKKALGE